MGLPWPDLFPGGCFTIGHDQQWRTGTGAGLTSARTASSLSAILVAQWQPTESGQPHKNPGEDYEKVSAKQPSCINCCPLSMPGGSHGPGPGGSRRW